MADYRRWRIIDLSIALSEIEKKYINIGDHFDSIATTKEILIKAITYVQNEIEFINNENAIGNNKFELVSIGFDHEKFNVKKIDATAEIKNMLQVRTEKLNVNKNDIDEFRETLEENLKSNTSSLKEIENILKKLITTYHQLEELYLTIRSIFETKIYGSKLKRRLQSTYLIVESTEKKLKKWDSDRVKEYIRKARAMKENKGKSVEKLLRDASSVFNKEFEAVKALYYYKPKKVRNPQ